LPNSRAFTDHGLLLSCFKPGVSHWFTLFAPKSAAECRRTVENYEVVVAPLTLNSSAASSRAPPRRHERRARQKVAKPGRPALNQDKLNAAFTGEKRHVANAGRAANRPWTINHLSGIQDRPKLEP